MKPQICLPLRKQANKKTFLHRNSVYLKYSMLLWSQFRERKLTTSPTPAHTHTHTHTILLI